MGSPSFREEDGDGALVVVVSVTPHQGAREDRVQGKAAQVTTIFRKSEVLVMRTAAAVLNIIQERGKRKNACRVSGLS